LLLQRSVFLNHLKTSDPQAGENLMIRKLCMLLALVLAVTGALFVPDASAQGEPTCHFVFVEEPASDPAPENARAPITGADDGAMTDSADVVGSADAIAVHSCADAEAYPGPFTNMPTTPSSSYSAPVGLSASSQVAQVAAADGADAGLAHSGSETFILAYLGTGLLAFGAVALGIRRGSTAE
jgi:hypothetical protein